LIRQKPLWFCCENYKDIVFKGMNVENRPGFLNSLKNIHIEVSVLGIFDRTIGLGALDFFKSAFELY